MTVKQRSKVNGSLTPNGRRRRSRRYTEHAEMFAFARRVIEAFRRADYSWEDIGEAVGITKQGAEQRWGERLQARSAA